MKHAINPVSAPFLLLFVLTGWKHSDPDEPNGGGSASGPDHDNARKAPEYKSNHGYDLLLLTEAIGPLRASATTHCPTL